MKITKEQLRKIESEIRREEAVESGFYDGRNAPKIHKDQKKETDKTACRKWKEQEEEEPS